MDVCSPTVFDMHVRSDGGTDAHADSREVTLVPVRVMSKRFVAVFKDEAVLAQDGDEGTHGRERWWMSSRLRSALLSKSKMHRTSRFTLSIPSAPK